MNNNNNLYYEYFEPEKLDQGLVCLICKNFLNDPIIDKCSNMFCRSCILNNNPNPNNKLNCPICDNNLIDSNNNNIIQPTIIPKYIINKLNEIQVLCKICKDKKPINRNEFQTIHLNQNQCKSEQCSFGCGLYFSKNEINDHINNKCPMIIVKCRASSVLCPYSSIRSLISNHELTCTYLSLYDVLSNLINSNKEKDSKILKLENELYLYKLSHLNQHHQQQQQQDPTSPQRIPNQSHQHSPPQQQQQQQQQPHVLSSPNHQTPFQFLSNDSNNIISPPNFVEIENPMDFNNEFSKLRLVIIFLTTTWCNVCKDIEPSFKHIAQSEPNITFLKVDIDKCSNLEVCKDVTKVPNFVGFKDNIQITESLIGAKKGNIEKLVLLLKS